MKALPTFKTSFLKRTKKGNKYLPKQAEPVQMQEQFSGAVPARNERPAAEVLAEVKTGSTLPVFIP